MIRILDFDQLAPEAFLNRDLRAEEDVSAAVDDILREVRTRGDAALRKFTRRFDGAEPENLRLTEAEINAAAGMVSPSFLKTLEEAAENIRLFHERQRHNGFVLTDRPGIVMGQRCKRNCSGDAAPAGRLGQSGGPGGGAAGRSGRRV